MAKGAARGAAKGAKDMQGGLAARMLVLLVGLTVLPALPAGRAAAQRDDVRFGATVVEIVTGAQVHRLRVQLATSPAQLARGLMFRKALAPWSGMLFDFGVPQIGQIWMRNTYIPLDILFIRPDGRIERIANGVPLSERIMSSSGPVRGVLELDRGAARLLGIKPGDRVRHAIFGTPVRDDGD
jgi:uncharacterized membrane protein (UPF0127 family)